MLTAHQQSNRQTPHILATGMITCYRIFFLLPCSVKLLLKLHMLFAHVVYRYGIANFCCLRVAGLLQVVLCTLQA